MEFMEPTHAKLIRALVGALHSWFSLRYCLFDVLILDSSWWYTWICFVFIVEILLFPIEEYYLVIQVRSLLIYFLRTLWTCMSLMTISIFDVILGCLDICLICLNKTNVVCYIPTLTFMFYDSAWRAVQVRTLTLLYCDLILFNMQFFEIT